MLHITIILACRLRTKHTVLKWEKMVVVVEHISKFIFISTYGRMRELLGSSQPLKNILKAKCVFWNISSYHN